MDIENQNLVINIFKALADPTRLRILALLNRSELTVQELTQILEIGQSRISHHLRVLLEAEILSVKRQGTWGCYRLSRDNPFFSTIFPSIETNLETFPQIMADSVNLLTFLDERRKSSREFFDQEASQWDRLIRNILPLPDYLETLSDMLPDVSLAVEVGCGTGNLMEVILRKASFVIAVDQSPEMIAEAGKKICDNKLQGIELRLGDMTHLPLGNSEADLVVMNMALHHAAQPLQTLKEVSRVLKRGGFFLLADMLPHKEAWVREKLADQWLGFSFPELKEWFDSVGFSIETWREIKGQGTQLSTFLLKGEKLSKINKSEIMSLFEES